MKNCHEILFLQMEVRLAMTSKENRDMFPEMLEPCDENMGGNFCRCLVDLILK